MKDFEMTEEQLGRLLDAGKPVPYLIFDGVAPVSPQEKANAVWRSLGDELGFDWTTVRPIPNKGQRHFRAEERAEASS